MPVARILGPVTILSDADIRQYLGKGEIRIAPYDEGHLTPNGYDVTIEEILIPTVNARTTVVILSDGLDRGEPRTLEQVGEHFHLTRERIRQLESRALAKLRHPSMGSKVLEFLS